MKVKGPRRSKLGHGNNSWQWAKHSWLYSDLGFRTREHLSAPGSQQEMVVVGGGGGGGRGLNFYIRSTSLLALI